MALLITLLGIAVSLAAQLALVLFLLDIGPLGIDRGTPPPVALAVSVNLLLVAGFGLIHSLMARPGFKAWWTAIVGTRAERGIFLLVSGLTLAAMLHAWQPIPESQFWSVDAEAGRLLIHALFAAGLGMLGWAILSIDPLHFHGLRQALESELEPPFAVRGPYRFVRHPIQTGLIVAVWASPVMSAGHALFAAAITAYSVAATLGLEERDLRRSLGQAYEDYRARVPALIPWRWPR